MVKVEKNGKVRTEVILMANIHMIYTREAEERGMTLKNLILEAVIEKMRREAKTKDRVKPDFTSFKGMNVHRTVMLLAPEMYKLMQSEAVWCGLTLQLYIATALIEKLKIEHLRERGPSL